MHRESETIQRNIKHDAIKRGRTTRIAGHPAPSPAGRLSVFSSSFCPAAEERILGEVKVSARLTFPRSTRDSDRAADQSFKDVGSIEIRGGDLKLSTRSPPLPLSLPRPFASSSNLLPFCARARELAERKDPTKRRILVNREIRLNSLQGGRRIDETQGDYPAGKGEGNPPWLPFAWSPVRGKETRET